MGNHYHLHSAAQRSAGPARLAIFVAKSHIACGALLDLGAMRIGIVIPLAYTRHLRRQSWRKLKEKDSREMATDDCLCQATIRKARVVQGGEVK